MAGRLTRRRVVAALLVLGVALAHLELAGELLERRLVAGGEPPPARFELEFVRRLEPTAPPPAPRAFAAPPPRQAAALPAAASAAERGQTEAAKRSARRAAEAAAEAKARVHRESRAAEAARADEQAQADEAARRQAAAEDAASAAASAAAAAAAASAAVAANAASEPAAAAAAAASAGGASAPGEPLALADAAVAAGAAAPFEWPPSTRLRYRLVGNYRGPVDGRATVEWLRRDSRYQVHVDVTIGLPFAPIVARRVTSEGRVTAAGLAPQRYDEETAILLRTPRRATVHLGETEVRLATGQVLPRPPGVQDSASQFVQLTWLFTLQPQLLEPGRSLQFALALPRHIEPWTYDIVEHETLSTPVGAIAAVHVRPRRPSRPGDLSAEMWIAPSLQYLPARIVIRQDADTWIDLVLDELPLQEAATPPAAASAPAAPAEAASPFADLPPR